MKLNDAVGARPSLEKMAAVEMDTASALKFARFVREVLMEIQVFEMERAELFKKYGVEAGEGEEKNIKILPENEEEFNAAITKALNKEIEIEPFDLTSINIAVAATELINALPLFK
jgi:hypothetical protein